jgi:hypothetical protein
MGMDRDTAQRMVTEVCEQYKESTKWKMTMVMYGPLRTPETLENPDFLDPRSPSGVSGGLFV